MTSYVAKLVHRQQDEVAPMGIIHQVTFENLSPFFTSQSGTRKKCSIKN